MSDAAQEAQVVEKTGIQIYQYFRDISIWRLLHHNSPLMLRGSGTVVQIDESLFHHKYKVRQTLCLCTAYMQIKGSNDKKSRSNARRPHLKFMYFIYM